MKKSLSQHQSKHLPLNALQRQDPGGDFFNRAVRDMDDFDAVGPRQASGRVYLPGGIASALRGVFPGGGVNTWLRLAAHNQAASESR